MSKERSREQKSKKKKSLNPPANQKKRALTNRTKAVRKMLIKKYGSDCSDTLVLFDKSTNHVVGLVGAHGLPDRFAYLVEAIISNSDNKDCYLGISNNALILEKSIRLTNFLKKSRIKGGKK